MSDPFDDVCEGRTKWSVSFGHKRTLHGDSWEARYRSRKGYGPHPSLAVRDLRSPALEARIYGGPWRWHPSPRTPTVHVHDGEWTVTPSRGLEGPAARALELAQKVRPSRPRPSRPSSARPSVPDRWAMDYTGRSPCPMSVAYLGTEWLGSSDGVGVERGGSATPKVSIVLDPAVELEWPAEMLPLRWAGDFVAFIAGRMVFLDAGVEAVSTPLKYPVWLERWRWVQTPAAKRCVVGLWGDKPIMVLDDRLARAWCDPYEGDDK